MNFLDNWIAFYFTTIQLKNHPEILKGKLPTVCMSQTDIKLSKLKCTSNKLK